MSVLGTQITGWSQCSTSNNDGSGNYYLDVAITVPVGTTYAVISVVQADRNSIQTTAYANIIGATSTVISGTTGSAVTNLSFAGGFAAMGGTAFGRMSPPSGAQFLRVGIPTSAQFGSGGVFNARIVYFDGVDTGTPVAAGNFGTALVGTDNPSIASTAATGDYAFSHCVAFAGSGFAAGASRTAVGVVQSNAFLYGAFDLAEYVTGLTNPAMPFVLTGATGNPGGWYINVLSVKAAAGGGGQVNAKNGIAISGISAFNGISKAGISAINGRTI